MHGFHCGRIPYKHVTEGVRSLSVQQFPTCFFVVDADDLAGMIGRFLESVAITHETLALDVIQQIGPVPGHFLAHPHTRKWYKKEQFIPKVADRLTYPELMENGKKSVIDYARDKMEELLSTHKPIPLDPNQEKVITKILQDARDYYKNKGLI